jgi:O-antigen ligase
VLYGGIALALSDVSVEKAYRGLVAVSYAGTVWMVLNAAYLLATGGTQTTADELSTGGTRVLSLSVSLHLATALFLALLNLQRDQSAYRRALHLLIVGLALLGIVLGFGRATFIAVGVVVPFILLGFRRVRGAFFDLLPLLAPVLVIAGFAVTRAEPTVGPTLVSRLSLSVVADQQDQSVRWRQEANRIVWEQVQESPYVGVGFGKNATFTLNNFRYETTQDPHNSFVWMLAGGGAFLLGSFSVIILLFARDAWRRHRRAVSDKERILLAWPVLAMVAFLLNATAGPMFSQASELLFLWTLLALPTVVRSARLTAPGTVART